MFYVLALSVVRSVQYSHQINIFRACEQRHEMTRQQRRRTMIDQQKATAMIYDTDHN